MKNRKQVHYSAAVFFTIAVLIMMTMATQSVYALSDPVINDKGITTWDTVYFGHYMQSSDGNGGFIEEPIRWRVLKVDGDDAYIMADKNIDAMPYCDTKSDKYECFWHLSTLRSWLNSYDSSENSLQKDYSGDGFIDRAFTNDEQEAIRPTEVLTYKDSDWGYHHYEKVTEDKIFLLEFDEIFSKSYGFTDLEDEAITRKAVNTAYTASGGTMGARNMNAEGRYDSWLLRSPGEYAMYADMITAEGAYVEDISDVNKLNNVCGIRPVLHLDLSKTDVWSDAGRYTARLTQTLTVQSRYEKKTGDADFDLNATKTGDSVITYSSSDGSVASVDSNGKVSIGKAGTAVITVTAPMTDSYEGVSKQVTVNVSKRLFGIKCDSASMLITDKPQKLAVSVEEGAKLFYMALDPEVVSVSDDGILTPLKAGSSEIMITAAEDEQHAETSIKVMLAVNKAKPIIKVKKTNSKFKVKKLKKKAMNFSIGQSSTSGSKTRCTKKSGHKNLKINKAGKVTVKKGAKKGSYTMKVQIKAAANDKYEAAVKIVTIKVKIK